MKHVIFTEKFSNNGEKINLGYCQKVFKNVKTANRSEMVSH